MKKIVSLFLVMTVVLCLTGCQKDKEIREVHIQNQEKTENKKEVDNPVADKEEEKIETEEEVKTSVETVNNEELSYWVNFLNIDGTVLERKAVRYGLIPEYKKDTPVYYDGEYDYVFKGWDKAISKVTFTQIYTAQYTKTKKTLSSDVHSCSYEVQKDGSYRCSCGEVLSGTDKPYAAVIVNGLPKDIISLESVNGVYELGKGSLKINDGYLDYENKDTAQKIIVRTDSNTEDLTIRENVGDTIYHYGTLSSLLIRDLTPDSYHERGRCDYAEIEQGRVVAEKNGVIEVALVRNENAYIQEKNGGKIYLAYASTQDIKDASDIADVKNGEKKHLTYIDESTEDFAQNIVARISDTGYTTLEEAFADVKAGETVEIVKDISYENKELRIFDGTNEVDFNINGNGHKLTAVSASGQMFMHFVTVNRNCIANIKNLQIETTGYQYALVYDGSDDGMYTSWGTIEDSSIVSDMCAVAVSGNDYGDSDAVLKNCSITHVARKNTYSYSDYLNTAVAPQFDGRVTLEDCTIVSDKYGVYVYSTGGIVAVKDTEVTAPTALIAQYTSGYSTVHEGSDITVKDSVITGNIEACSSTDETVVLEGKTTVSGTIGNGVTDNRE